eukprot:scaffold40846_cov20-Tisochrysis_lutea.AAC.2
MAAMRDQQNSQQPSGANWVCGSLLEPQLQLQLQQQRLPGSIFEHKVPGRVLPRGDSTRKGSAAHAIWTYHSAWTTVSAVTHTLSQQADLRTSACCSPAALPLVQPLLVQPPLHTLPNWRATLHQEIAAPHTLHTHASNPRHLNGLPYSSKCMYILVQGGACPPNINTPTPTHPQHTCLLHA